MAYSARGAANRTCPLSSRTGTLRPDNRRVTPAFMQPREGCSFTELLPSNVRAGSLPEYYVAQDLKARFPSLILQPFPTRFGDNPASYSTTQNEPNSPSSRNDFAWKGGQYLCMRWARCRLEFPRLTLDAPVTRRNSASPDESSIHDF